MLRIALMISLAMLAQSVQADNPGSDSSLPSRNPGVVLPILEKFSPKDTSLSAIQIEFDKIIGENSGARSHGSNPNFTKLLYVLDDKTMVAVESINLKLVRITYLRPDYTLIKVLYTAPGSGVSLH